MIQKLINWIKSKMAERKKKAAFKKVMDQYKKQDPFNYKSF